MSMYKHSTFLNHRRNTSEAFNGTKPCQTQLTWAAVKTKRSVINEPPKVCIDPSISLVNRSTAVPQNGALFEANRMLTIHGLCDSNHATIDVISPNGWIPGMWNTFNATDDTSSNDRLIKSTATLDGWPDSFFLSLSTQGKISDSPSTWIQIDGSRKNKEYADGNKHFHRDANESSSLMKFSSRTENQRRVFNWSRLIYQNNRIDG